MAETEIAYDEMLSAMGRQLQPNAIRKLTALLGRRDMISLAAGAPSAETFPLEELAEILIPIPPLEKQHTIARAFAQLQKMRRDALKAGEALVQQTERLIQE